MSEIDELMQRGADAYASGEFAVAQEAWQAAADAGHDGAYDALRLLAHGDTRRHVLWGKLAERDNAGALWSLGVAAVERADLPGVRDSWSQAADASAKDIERLCTEALEHHFWSVCVNGSRVAQAASLPSAPSPACSRIATCGR